MLKDNIYTVLPKEDVIVKKSSLATELATQKMSSKTVIIITSLVALVLITAITVGIWWTQPIKSSWPDIQMYAVRIEEDGTRHKSGQVTIRGIRYDYRDQDALPELHPSEITILEEVFSTDTAVLYFLPYGTISGLCHSSIGSYALTIDLSPDGDWCVIRKNDYGLTHYIVCSTTENFDPMEIFTRSIFCK